MKLAIRPAALAVAMIISGCSSGEYDLEPLPEGLSGCYLSERSEKFRVDDGNLTRLDGEFLTRLDGVYSRGKNGDRLFASREIFYTSKSDKMLRGRKISIFVEFEISGSAFVIYFVDLDSDENAKFVQSLDPLACEPEPSDDQSHSEI